MKVTNKWLTEKNACDSGFGWAQTQEDRELRSVCKALLEYGRFDWANWLIVRCLSRQQCVEYAAFAARLILFLFEDKYPNDDRPRKAIEAAENYLNRGGSGTAAAYAAADAAAAAAYDAAATAYAATAADAAAAAAAYAAADAAAAAAYDAAAAYAATAADAYAAAAAAYDAAAAYAATAADAESIKTNIIMHGVDLVESLEGK